MNVNVLLAFHSEVMCIRNNVNYDVTRYICLGIIKKKRTNKLIRL